MIHKYTVSILSNFRIRGLVLASIAGLALALAGNFHQLWWLSLVSFLPVFYLFYSDLKVREVFVFSLVFGLIYFAAVFFWVWSVLPLDWAGIDGYFASRLLVFYSWFIFSLPPALVVGLWGLVFKLLKKNSWSDVWLVSLLWLVAEYLWSVLTSVVSYGPGGLIGANWSVGFVGYSLAPSQLFLPLAFWGGVWALSFSVVLINGALYHFLLHYRRSGMVGVSRSKLPTAALGLLVIVLIGFYGSSQFQDDQDYRKIPVGLVTTYEPSYSLSTREYREQVTESLAELFETRSLLWDQIPELVILPEDSRFLVGLLESEREDFVTEIFGLDSEVLFIDSARIPNQQGSPNLTFLYVNSLNLDMTTSSKRLLVPHGEYAPYLSRFILHLLGQGDWVRGFDSMRGNTPGEFGTGYDFKGYRVQATVCSEIMMPYLYSQIAQDSPLLINSASHSLFRGSNILYNQTINMAKVRAVETNRYFIYSANFVPSFVIDNRGQMIFQSQSSEVNSLDLVEVGLIDDYSGYQFWYWLTPWLVIVATAWVSYLLYRRQDLDRD